MFTGRSYFFSAACLFAAVGCFEADLVVPRASSPRAVVPSEPQTKAQAQATQQRQSPDPAVLSGPQAQATRQWYNRLVAKAVARTDGGVLVMLAPRPRTARTGKALLWLDRNLEDEGEWCPAADEDLLDFVLHDDGDLTVILGSRAATTAQGSLRPLQVVRLRDGVRVQRLSLRLPEGRAALSTDTRVQLLAQGPHLAAVFVDLGGTLHILALGYDKEFSQQWARTLQPEDDATRTETLKSLERFKAKMEAMGGSLDTQGGRLSALPAVMDTEGSVYALINTLHPQADWHMLGGSGGRSSLTCPVFPEQPLPQATLLHKVDVQGRWRYATCLNDTGVFDARLHKDTLHLLGGQDFTWYAGYAADAGTTLFRREKGLKSGSVTNLVSSPRLLAVGITGRETEIQHGDPPAHQAAVYRLDEKTKAKAQTLFPKKDTNSQATLIEAIAGDRILIGGSIDAVRDEYQISDGEGFVAIYGADTF